MKRLRHRLLPTSAGVFYQLETRRDETRENLFNVLARISSTLPKWESRDESTHIRQRR